MHAPQHVESVGIRLYDGGDVLTPGTCTAVQSDTKDSCRLHCLQVMGADGEGWRGDGGGGSVEIHHHLLAGVDGHMIARCPTFQVN